MKKLVSLLLVLLMLLSVSAMAQIVQMATVYVSSSGGTLHLRQYGTTESDSMGFVKHGDSVKIISKGEEWSYVYVERTAQSGYMKTKYLRDITSVSDGASATRVTPYYDNAIEVTGTGEFECDLNGDGQYETISVNEQTDGYDSTIVNIVIADPSGKTDQLSTYITNDWHVFFAVLDESSPVVSILVSGDECSSDYITYMFRWTDGKIQYLNIVNQVYNNPDSPSSAGAVTEISGSTVVLADHKDIFGTWWAKRPYLLSEDGESYMYDANALWTFSIDLTDPEYWTYGGIEVISPLPVVMYGQNTVLPEGSVITFTAYNEKDTAYFITNSGDCGYVTYADDPDGWSHTINGINESTYFKTLPYAG